MIITSIFGFIYGRSVIVAYAPASSILYDKIGLHVPVPGEFLVIKNVGVWRENSGGMEVLAVKGELFNPNETIKFEYQTPFPDEKTVSVIVTFSDEKRSNQYGY